MGCCVKTVIVLLPVVVGYFLLCGCNFDPESIRGKRVLVTGASSGIGEKVAYKYAELGAKLVISARRAELLEKVAKRCKELGAETVLTVPADMASPADRKKLVEATEKHLGGIDFLVLNHVYMKYSWWKGTAEDLKLLEEMTNINLISFVDITSQFLQSLEKSQGHIVVVSSVAGKIAAPGTAHYSSNKHALQGFYSSLRQELKFRKTGVSVTVVVYGPVDSDNAIEIMKGIPLKMDFMSFAGSTDEAANRLVKGASARTYEIFYPAISPVMTFLHRLFPNCIEDMSTSMFLTE